MKRLFYIEEARCLNVKAEYASYVYVYVYCTSQSGRLEYNFLFLDLGGCGEEGMSTYTPHLPFTLILRWVFTTSTCNVTTVCVQSYVRDFLTSPYVTLRKLWRCGVRWHHSGLGPNLGQCNTCQRISDSVEHDISTIPQGSNNGTWLTSSIHWIIFIVALRRLRVFENRVLRIISGPRRDGVTGEWGNRGVEETT